MSTKNTEPVSASDQPPTPKFKPGQYVRCIDSFGHLNLTKGAVYEVSDVDSAGVWVLIGGSAGRCGWHAQARRFEALPTETPTPAPVENPKDTIGSTKLPFHTIPAQVLGEAALVLFSGGLKYAEYNWREAGVRASVYYDACRRHLDAWWEGQDEDPESGLSHLAHALAGLIILRDSQCQGNWIDNRPPKATNQNWVADLNAKAKALLERTPYPKAPVTEVGLRAGPEGREAK